MILPSMQDDVTPRNLAERTGRHFCVRCKAEVPADIYFANDFECDECVETDEAFPLASTPEETKKDEG
jgi:hypothetical protein